MHFKCCLHGRQEPRRLLKACPAPLLLRVFLTGSLAATPSDLSVTTLLPALETLP